MDKDVSASRSQTMENSITAPRSVVEATRLRERGRLREADGVLSEAVKAPDPAPVEYIDWVKIAVIQAHFEQAWERLARIEGVIPKGKWNLLKYSIFIESRDYDGAVSCLGELTEEFDAAVIERVNHFCTVLKAADTAFRRQRTAATDYMAICINLDEHEQKFARCLRVAKAANLQLKRVSALKGNTVPDGMFPMLGRNVSPHFKGTLGCFASHFHAWELFLKASADFAVILEDDFLPMVSFPGSMSAFEIPGPFDICWINEGMALPGSTTELQFLPVAPTVQARVRAFWPGNGAYGYIVSRAGAEKLIANVIEDGFFGDVDWRMLAYALDAGTIKSLPEKSFARRAMTAHLKVMKPRPPLRAFAASVGIIAHTQSGSSRDRLNTRRHAHEHV